MVVIFSLFGILIGEGVYVNYVEQEIAYNKCLPYKDLSFFVFFFTDFCSKSPSFLRAILVTFSDIASSIGHCGGLYLNFFFKGLFTNVGIFGFFQIVICVITFVIIFLTLIFFICLYARKKLV